jgi:hypothetical protein
VVVEKLPNSFAASWHVNPRLSQVFLGGEAVSAKLSEVLFVETLRAYIADLPAHQTGWLAGARVAEVGKALALMHRNPAHLG